MVDEFLKDFNKALTTRPLHDLEYTRKKRKKLLGKGDFGQDTNGTGDHIDQPFVFSNTLDNIRSGRFDISNCSHPIFLLGYFGLFYSRARDELPIDEALTI